LYRYNSSQNFRNVAFLNTIFFKRYGAVTVLKILQNFRNIHTLYPNAWNKENTIFRSVYYNFFT
jgi:hypothetical protein